MWILPTYFGVFLAIIGFRHYPVVGFELDPRLSSVWERSRVMMHEISRRGPCSDGRLPVLTGINASGELYTYDLQCGDVRSEEQRIGRRDTETLCTTSCTQVCYHPADYNPDPKDCGNATAILNQQNSNWDVPVGGTKVVTYKTCTYIFVNQGHETINFCDTALASIGNSIAWTCGRWLADPAKGGICTQTDFYVEAIRTPNMPGPSYSITFSTVASTDLDGLPSTGAATTASTESAALGTTTSAAGIQNSTGLLQTTSELPSGSSGSAQSIPDGPSVTFAQGMLDSGPSGTASAGASVGPAPPKQADLSVAIGASIGGIACLALVVAGVLLYRRIKRQEERANQHAAYPISPMNQLYPGNAWLPASVFHRPKKTRRPRSPIPATPSINSHAGNGLLQDNSDVTSSVASHAPDYSYPQPHPRSTEALIAAAAPPDMSREQIDILAANFVSLVRGRDPQEDGDAPELPPYHRA